MHYLDNKVFDITDARCNHEDKIHVDVRFGSSESIGRIVEVFDLAKAEEHLFALHSATTSVS